MAPIKKMDRIQQNEGTGREGTTEPRRGPVVASPAVGQAVKKWSHYLR